VGRSARSGLKARGAQSPMPHRGEPITTPQTHRGIHTRTQEELSAAKLIVNPDEKPSTIGAVIQHCDGASCGLRPLQHMLATAQLACADPVLEDGECLGKAALVVEHDEAAHLCAVHKQ
jgi:hypothetical protein